MPRGQPIIVDSQSSMQTLRQRGKLTKNILVLNRENKYTQDKALHTNLSFELASTQDYTKVVHMNVLQVLVVLYERKYAYKCVYICVRGETDSRVDYIKFP